MADYNINAVTRRVVFTGSAGVGPYSFTFEVLDQNDLAVYFNTTKLTLTTDYTVSIAANGTGSVTIVVGTNVPTTPDADDTIIIVGARDIERTTDFVTAGDLRASALNEQLDGLTIFDQQIAEEQKRTLQAPVYDPAHVDDGGTLDMTLPAKAARAGKYLQFNSTTGNPEAGPDSTDVTALADIATDIATLADIEDGTDATDAIQTVAGISANVTTVAGVAANVTTVAGQTTNMQNITDNLTAVQNAATNATNAAASASAAATSETNAATSETNAASSASSASTSETNSAASATASAASAASAATSELNASTSETNAASSASSASTDAATATTQAGIATTKAGEASTSASNAATSETNAATSASNAASSATAAAASQTAAAASAASAANSYDQFDDRYLGTKTADPTLDNDGNALVAGALYFNSVANEMRVYDGGSWIAASSAGGASLNTYEYTATAAQTTFSGADDNGATLSYTIDNIIVTLNGVVLDPDDYTATSGTSIVLNTGAALNDELNVVAFKSFTTADMVSATNGGTFGNSISVTGTVSATSFSGDGSSLTGISTDLVNDTTPQLGGNLDTNGNDITFGDNDKAIFGAGSDLQIYHNGNHSFIEDSGTGDLQIKATNISLKAYNGETYIDGTQNGAVNLYYDNAAKLATTATGIDVTGTVTATAFVGDGSGLTGVSGGKLLQVVSAELAKSTGTSTTSTSYIDTGLTASITPTTTGNKIKVTVVHNNRHQAASGQDLQYYYRLLVGATVLDEVFAAGDNLGKLGDTAIYPFSHIQTYVYTAPSTAALTFKTQVKVAASTTAYYRYNDAFIILEEIAS